MPVCYKQITCFVKRHGLWGNLGGKGAPHAIGSKLEDRILLPVRHKQIALAVKGQESRMPDPSGERALLSIGREFEDRVVAVARHKKIARSVKGHGSRAEPGGKGTLRSVGCESKDRILRVRHSRKEIALFVKSQFKRVSMLKPGCKGALVSIRSEFDDRVTIDRKDITRSVKGHAGKFFPGGERALLSVGRKFKDRVASLLKKIPRSIKSQLNVGVGADGKQDCSQAGDCYRDK